LRKTKDNIIYFETPFNTPQQTTKLLAEKIKSLSGILDVSISSGAPIITTGESAKLKNPANGIEFVTRERQIDSNFLKLYSLRLISGRNIVMPFGQNNTEFIINETCAKQLGFTDPSQAVGKEVQLEMWGSMRGYVVGVVSDFNSETLHKVISPVLFLGSDFYTRTISVKTDKIGQKQGQQNNQAALNKIWNELFPNEPIDIKYFDEMIRQFYEKENRASHLITISMIITIIISCTGLFGLVTLVLEQKRKEIGIRKILGARVTSLFFQISKEFLLIIGIAILIASPIAWYFAQVWIQNFAYHISINIWYFILGALFTMIVAFLTISYKIITASQSNPVDNLKVQ